MRADPFLPLTRRRRLSAARDRARELLLRPFRGTRIAPRRQGPPNLLILAVDTLRWDHARGGRAATPHLDALAREGLTFDDVTAAAPWTLPSFSSALTGLMPTLHGAGMRGAVRNMAVEPPAELAPGAVTLPAHLAAHGYVTGAVYSNPFVEFGLAESFGERRYRNHAAAHVAARALEWIRRHGDRPFCCFVLFNDPHEPTLPPPRFWPEALGDAAGWSDEALRSLARWGDDGAAPHLGRLGAEPDDRGRAALAVKQALYAGAVGAVDAAVGAVLEQLGAWGLDDTTLVTVFSDHGEEFREHAAAATAWDHDPRDLRAVGHGHSLFQELVHVPWLVRGPGVPAGVRRGEAVSLTDVAPTLCRWLGAPDLPLPAAAYAPLTGRALPRDTAAPDPDRVLLCEDLAYGPDLVSVRRGPWKLTARRDGTPLVLHHLQDDPAETRDLLTTAPEAADDLGRELRTWRAAGSPGDAGGAWADRDDEIRRRLKDLGYGG
ncbi:MAG TPA: sulfatase [Candidatus Krumholzibacteria bacterium]|nr:sulfatase [Candidatus Krumholzibacteria bacterium]